MEKKEKDRGKGGEGRGRKKLNRGRKGRIGNRKKDAEEERK